MANKTTGITLRLTATDATSRAFKNIASSAAKVTGTIAKWGAAAAGIATGALALTANKLSKLSDVAQSAGATTEEITKLSGALDMLGVKGTTPEDLAAAFQRMTKSTGEVGVEGFHKVIAEISQLPTIMERSAAAQKVFGKSGLNFLPIIEGDINALKDLEAAIPGISQAAADAGDAFADGMGVMKRAASKVWNEGLMKVAEMIAGKFTGDVRTAALVCAAQFEYFAKAAWAYLKPFITDTKAAFLQLAEWISRVMNNAMTVVGGIITTVGENIATRTKGIIGNLVDGVKLIVAEATGDRSAANKAMDSILAREKDVAKKTSSNWEQTFDTLKSQLDWSMGDGPLGNVDLSALQAQRDAAIETAKKAGEAYRKAAVTISPEERSKIGAGASGRGGAADRATNPEAILGGTYKAITYAMRAGYATAQDRIAKGVDKIAGLLKGVKDNTEELADNLEFGVAGG